MNIPEELKRLAQWVLWRYEQRNGTQGGKKPYQVAGQPANVGNPATWCDFETATKQREDRYDGIGFVFSHTDPYVGLDFDGCRQPNGTIVPWAAQWLEALDSYSEVSPSGEGVKVWIRASLPECCKHTVRINAPSVGEKDPAIEVYGAGRYFAVTGQQWGERSTIEERQRQLDALLARFGMVSPPAPAPAPAAHNGGAYSEADYARWYLDRLDPWRCDDYNQWLAVGMALTALGSAGLDLWDSWSRQSSKHREGECARRWHGFKLDQHGIGKLGKWANHDDPRPTQQPHYAPRQTSNQTRGGERPAALADASPPTSGERDRPGGPGRSAVTSGSGNNGAVVIDITDEHLGTQTPEVWKAVQQSAYAQHVYRYGDSIAYNGTGGFEVVDTHTWRGIVNRAAVFQKTRNTKQGGEANQVYPPVALVRDSLNRQFIPDGVREVRRVVSVPVLDQAGQLLLAGYHPDSQILSTSEIDPVPMDIDTALNLVYELLQDFPFADPASFANTVGLLVLPFVREMVGATPLHLIDASQRGTGKGLLSDLLHTIWTGGPADAGDLPLNAEEQRKTITTMLQKSPISVVFDDVSILTGHAIQRAITASSWTDRQLGQNKDITVPVRTVWMATGNNVTLGGDMVRRVVLIRLESPEEYPWERKDFHRSEAEIRQWVRDERTRFVSACLAVAQHGLAAGAPPATPVLGGFDAYARVLATILNGCNIDGFLGNTDRTKDREDTRQTGWKAVIREWWEQWGTRQVKAGEVTRLIEGMEDCDIVLDGDNTKARQITVGKLLRSLDGSTYAFEGVRVKLSSGHNTKGDRTYCLVLVGEIAVFATRKPARNVANVANIDIATHAHDAHACMYSERATSATFRYIPLGHQKANEEQPYIGSGETPPTSPPPGLVDTPSDPPRFHLPDGWKWILVGEGTPNRWQARSDNGTETAAYTGEEGGRMAVVREAWARGENTPETP